MQSLIATTLTFYVKHRPENVEKLHRILEEVSDPVNPHYGRYLSHSQVQELQRPSPEHISAVHDHIRAMGGVSISNSTAGDKVIAKIPLPAVASMAEYFEYVTRKSATSSIPSVEDAVDTVSGLFRATKKAKNPSKKKKSKSSDTQKSKKTKQHSPDDDPQKCLADRVTPPCLRKAYGIESEVNTAAKNGQAVVVDQGYILEDLHTFCSEYNLHHCPKTITNVHGSPAAAASNGPIDEASLDIQYSVATGQGVAQTWVLLDGSSNPFTGWLTWASNTSDIPWVQSLSVGAPEPAVVGTAGIGLSGVTRMNNEIAALGVRGVSVVAAAGDKGYHRDWLIYPSSSPFVTSVGGVFDGDLGDSPLEVDGVTTGGFSSLPIQPIQKWQMAAVAEWEKTVKNPPYYNASRRACPDLSVFDSGFYIVEDGMDTPIGETSAAAPTLAGMISSINGHLLNAGKPTLGFLNPFLYSMLKTDTFLDVVHGQLGGNGFEAIPGYDPASGLGTFSPTTFSLLKAAALKRNMTQM